MAFRGFISVDLPDIESMTAFAEELWRTGAAVKPVDVSQVHFTLKFLGDTEEALVPRILDVMRHSVTGIPSFTIRLVGTGAFPNLRRMNVIWVGTEGAEPLVEIARRLEAALEPLGYPRERREFSAHVTVARVKGPRSLDDVRRVIEARARDVFGEVRVDRLRLKKSVLGAQGPTYSTVAEVSL